MYKINWTYNKSKADFTNKLIPESNIKSCGIPIKEVRLKAKELTTHDIEINYIEDILVLGINIAQSKLPFEDKIKQLNDFKPLVISWLVTDCIACSFKINKAEKDLAFKYFLSLLYDNDPMIKRFAIIILMDNFLTEDYLCTILNNIANIQSDIHLLNMGLAWFFTTSFIKYPEITTKYVKYLNPIAYKMFLQKCRDSKRIKKDEIKVLTNVSINSNVSI